jgi:hypothetical protein
LSLTRIELRYATETGIYPLGMKFCALLAFVLVLRSRCIIMSRIKKMRALERPRTELPPSPPKKAIADLAANENLLTEDAEPTEVAEYLAALLEGARGMAGKAGMTFLAYLIQVAVEEARIQAASKEQPY